MDALHRRRRRPPSAAGGADRLVLAGAAVVAVFVVALLLRSDRVPRGVAAGGVPLGGLSGPRAAERMIAAWPTWWIAVDVQGEPVAVPPESLGIVLDPVATVERARRAGRSPWEILKALVTDRRIDTDVVWSFDEARAAAGLAELATGVAVAPQPAGIALRGNRAEALPPTPGRALDAAATLALLRASPADVVSTRSLTAAVSVVPPEVSDATAAAAAANRRLAATVEVDLYDPVLDETVPWVLPPERWSQLVRAAVAADGLGVTWTADDARVAEAVAGSSAIVGADRYLDAGEVASALADAIENGVPAEARIFHHDARHVVVEGETIASIAAAHGVPFPWVEQANPGLGDELWPGQTVVIPSSDTFLPLPIVPDRRIIVDIGRQRMWVYEDGVLRWDWPVSTGIASSPTSPGVFQVLSKSPTAYASSWDLDMPHFIGIYRPVPTSPFTNGFHGYPSRGGGQILWQNALGYPVTYGCVLVDSANAEELFDWAEPGTVVEIRPAEAGGSDATETGEGG